MIDKYSRTGVQEKKEKGICSVDLSGRFSRYRMLSSSNTQEAILWASRANVFAAS